MAEAKPRSGWFKAIIGTVAGVASGGAMMYLSPLLDQVVKPPRPLANFAVETDGLTATFHNRFAGDGWWDFGDGSPLEAADSDQPTITHTYAKPGTYTAKLTVRNYLGDEHERTVGVDVTVVSTNAATPAIATLDVVPTSNERTAPATFRVSAQVSNAERCLWDLGYDKPLEVVADSKGKIERLVTFATPGTHVVQVMALNGSQTARRAVALQVDPPAGNALVARLRVTDRGGKSERRQFSESVPIALPRQSRSVVAIDRKIAARGGFSITDAKVGKVDPAFQNLKAVVLPDGKTVHLTGTLTPTADMHRSATPPMVTVYLTEERKVVGQSAPQEVSSAIKVPGIVSLPLPAAGDAAQRSMVLELRGAGGTIWQQPVPAKSSTFDFENRRYTITATPGENEVRVEITGGTIGLTGREK